MPIVIEIKSKKKREEDKDIGKYKKPSGRQDWKRGYKHHKGRGTSAYSKKKEKEHRAKVRETAIKRSAKGIPMFNTGGSVKLAKKYFKGGMV